MRHMPALLALAAVAALAACSSPAKQAGNVTPDEAAQLNNAAEVLDASPDSLAAPADNRASPGND